MDDFYGKTDSEYAESGNVLFEDTIYQGATMMELKEKGFYFTKVSQACTKYFN